MSKKPYNILTVREYTDNNGEVRKEYTRVGVAFEIDSGGMSCEVAPNIAIHGKFVILPRREKGGDDGQE